jgi:hypothetical protein
LIGENFFLPSITKSVARRQQRMRLNNFHLHTKDDGGEIQIKLKLTSSQATGIVQNINKNREHISSIHNIIKRRNKK